MTDHCLPRANALSARVVELLKQLSQDNFDGVKQELLGAFGEFVRVVHSELPLSDAQGPKLATAACVPLWEALHVLSGPFAQLEPPQRAFAIQLLTALYPKAKDRRCLWQQQGCFGSIGTADRLSLETRVPCGSELITEVPNEPSPYSAALRFVNSTKALEIKLAEGRAGIDAFKDAMRRLSRDVLPRCVLVPKGAPTGVQPSGDVHLAIEQPGGIPPVPSCRTSAYTLTVLRHMVWKYLLIAQSLAGEESRALCSILSESPWSRKTVPICGERQPVLYQHLFQPLIDQLALTSSLTLGSTNADENAPVVDPSVVPLLVPSDDTVGTPVVIRALSLAGKRDRVTDPPSSALQQYRWERRRYLAVTRDALPSSDDGGTDDESEDVIRRKRENLVEMLQETIPAEIEMGGSSGSCRDCDQLTRLCRDFVFLPGARLPQSTAAVSLDIPAGLVGRLLFDRGASKRPRESDGADSDPPRRNTENRAGTYVHNSDVLRHMVESPALLPVVSDLAEFFGTSGGADGSPPSRVTPLVTLERVIVDCSATPGSA